jgi:glycopeptide antibiotics resistance protein
MLQNVQYLPVSLFMGIAAYFLVFFFQGICRTDSVSCRTFWTPQRHIVFALLVFYLTLMFYIVLWSREPGSRLQISLVPGETWTEDMQGRAYVIENVMLFVPFGVFVAAWCDRFRIGIAVLCGAGLSFVIEMTQYLTRRGFLQVDDVITNILGTLAGALVYSGIRRIMYQWFIGKRPGK